MKRQLQSEMGLFPVRLLRDRKESFVELNAKDSHGKTSYGTAGPDADRPAYDVVLQAESGLMSLTGVEEGRLIYRAVREVVDLGPERGCEQRHRRWTAAHRMSVR